VPRLAASVRLRAPVPAAQTDRTRTLVPQGGGLETGDSSAGLSTGVAASIDVDSSSSSSSMSGSVSTSPIADAPDAG
jgi:hypothetical protein